MDTHFQSMSGRHYTFERPGSDIKKTGYLRKLKTMKKKFFVLRSTSSSGPARLEYYDSEKKFQSATLPKRSILLHTCFNINKKSGHGKPGIVLYTIQDSFTVLVDSEDEQENWLGIMLEYQNEYIPEGHQMKEHYEHVWQVTMQPRGLGQGKGVKGQYRLCLNNKTVNMYKINSSQPQFTIQLVTIRAVAHNENSFWLAVGNYASTGPGEFWFLVEDTDVAKDMHTTILRFMNSMKDYFQKDQHVVYPRRDTHSSFHDDFGGSHQLHSDFRKSFSISGYADDTDYSMTHPDALKDLSPSLNPSDLDGEINTYFGMAASDYTTMKVHHGLQSSHPSSVHSHTFSELLHLTHLPTVKEGGSGEGFLLSELPNSCTSSSDFPRPEPATCLLSDDHGDPISRSYSLGSRPVKKLQGYSEAVSRKGLENEISRATSAPHIVKGRRDREYKTDSPSSAASQLSMSLKSDDSESFMEHFPMRPRTSSDSFNYRTRTSSFGKQQQTCRPRSSSYGQGKRPIIDMHKLNLKKAIMSKDALQRTSWESSLQGSFESLRVSSESLRKTSQELRQAGRSNTCDLAEIRNTPSPKLINMKSDLDDFVDVHGRTEQRKTSPHRTRTDSMGSGRSHGIMTSGLDHQSYSQQTDERTSKVMPSAGSGNGMGSYVNVDYNTQHRVTSDTKSVPKASQIQPSHPEHSRYVRPHGDSKYKKSAGSRSLSMENVDTYHISDFTLNGSKPRTGSVGSKDKKTVRPGLTRKSSSISVSVPSSTSVILNKFQPGVCHQQPHPPVSSSVVSHQQQPNHSVSSSGITHRHQPHPLIASSTRNFGSSDSIRKPSRQSSTEKFGILGKDFRKKSGSTGSRPISENTSLVMAVGKEQYASGANIMPLRKPSSANILEDESTYEYVEFSPAVTTAVSLYSHGQSSFTQSELSQHSLCSQCSGRRQSLTRSEGVSYVHYNPVCSSAENEFSALYTPSACSTASSIQAEHPHVNSHKHPPKPLLENPASSYSAQIKQASPKNIPDVACGPGMVACSASSHSSSNKKPIDNKGFKHGLIPSSVQATLPSSVHEPANYQVEQISPFQQQKSLDTVASLNKPASCTPCVNTCLPLSASHSFDPSSHSGRTGALPRMPPIPPLPSPVATLSHQTQASSKQAGQDENKYLSSCPDASTVRNTQQDGTLPEQAEGGKVQDISSLAQLSHVTGEEANSSSTQHKYADVKDLQQQLRHQVHKLHQTQNFHRQLSAPAYPSIPTSTSARVLSEVQPQVQTQRTEPSNSICTSGHKNLGESSVLDSTLSAGSGMKHLHLSGFSNASKESCKRSDLSTGSLDEKSRHQVLSRDNTTQSIAERNPLSPSRSVDELNFFETSPFNLKPFESKIIPPKARTRHSLGDIMSVVSAEKRRNHALSQLVISPAQTSDLEDLSKL